MKFFSSIIAKVLLMFDCLMLKVMVVNNNKTNFFKKANKNVCHRGVLFFSGFELCSNF